MEGSALSHGAMASLDLHNAMDHTSLFRNRDILMKEDSKLIIYIILKKNTLVAIL